MNKQLIRYYKIYDFKIDGAEPQQLNKPRTIDIEGKHICLIRLSDGYFALDDKCPHAAGRLGMGQCDEEDFVICPIHRYKYNARTGKGHPRQGDYVNNYPVETRTDGVYIGIKKKWWQVF